jgi:hypothetical protein
MEVDMEELGAPSGQVLWIAERLQHRGLQHNPRCALCDQEPETMHHLLITCPFWRHVWHEVLSWLRLTMMKPRSMTSG